MLLDKRRASLFVKIGALFLAVTFAGYFIAVLIPSFQGGYSGNTKKQSEDQQREIYGQEQARIEALISQNPKDENLWVELGNLHFDNKDYGKAVEVYTKALELNPENLNVRVDLGSSYSYLDKLHEAKQQFELVIDKDPNHLVALYNMGVVSIRQGDESKAQEYWGKVVKLAPEADIGKAAKQSLDSLK